MRDRDLILVILFIVVPFLQWLARQIQAARERAAERNSESKLETVWSSEKEDRPVSPEDDDALPEWFPEGVWETVEDPEPIREEIPMTSATPPPPPERELVRPSPRRPSLTTAASDLAAESSKLGDTAARPLGEETPAVARASRQLSGSHTSRRRSSRLAGRSELQKAVIWSEILGKPRALNPHSTDER